ncbi:MAG TPA: hypothetical protein VHH36_06275 [Candidatus Thermoplasmatota archaeon]|nr:hypothetical protein [Candidatus Thermoplasmatota archaeon]
MPRKAAATEKPTKKAAPKKAPAKAAKPKEEAPVAPAPAEGAAAPAKKAAKKAAAPKASSAKAPKPPVERTRVALPKDLYEPRKDEIKAPLKEQGLKWQYLGEGKGRYHKDGVNVFTQFLDDGVHYSVWGDDKAAVRTLLDAWRKLLGDEAYAKATARGEEAVKAEEAQQESEALRLWRLQEPQRRPGEPDFFFKRRMDEWTAKKPAS